MNAIPIAPRVPGSSASATIAPQPAKTRAKTPIPSAAARRMRSGRPSTLSAAGGRGGEDVADGVQGARDEREVAAGAAPLALRQARLDQHLEVMADGRLGEAEEGLELADAN